MEFESINKKRHNYNDISEVSGHIFSILGATENFRNERNFWFFISTIGASNFTTWIFFDLSLVKKICEKDPNTSKRIISLDFGEEFNIKNPIQNSRSSTSLNLISMYNNLLANKEPACTLYRSENLDRTLIEFLNLDKNRAFYQTPNLGNVLPETIKNSIERVKKMRLIEKSQRKDHNANRRGRGSSMQGREGGAAGKLYGVTFYNKDIENGGYIKNLDVSQ